MKQYFTHFVEAISAASKWTYIVLVAGFIVGMFSEKIPLGSVGRKLIEYFGNVDTKTKR